MYAEINPQPSGNPKFKLAPAIVRVIVGFFDNRSADADDMIVMSDDISTISVFIARRVVCEYVVNFFPGMVTEAAT